MADLLRGENNGVIVDVRPTDFTAMGESGVVYRAVNPSGKWRSYKPSDEWQRRYIPPGTLGYDTNSCTDFSCMNDIELQIQRMLADGEVPDDVVSKMQALGYFDSNGFVNFSDWYNAVTAGTTWEKGNTLYAPWDAVRKYGVLPQGQGPTPNSFTTHQEWFNYKPSNGQIKAAQEFGTMFDVKYEWVVIGQVGQYDTLEYHLKQAPLHVLVPTGATWDDMVADNPTPVYSGVNHAVTLLEQDSGKTHTVLDHYNRFIKTLKWGYYIPFALKGVVTLKTTPTLPKPFAYTFTINLRYGAPIGPEVRKLQEALQHIGYMKSGLFGPYGPATKEAVANFQKANGILDPEGPGINFGPKTRSAMNKRLNG